MKLDNARITFQGKLEKAYSFWIAVTVHVLFASFWIALVTKKGLSEISTTLFNPGTLFFILIVSLFLLYFCPIDERYEVVDGFLKRRSWLRPWRNSKFDLRQARWIGYGFSTGKTPFRGIDIDVGSKRVRIPSLWKYEDFMKKLRQDLSHAKRPNVEETFE